MLLNRLPSPGRRISLRAAMSMFSLDSSCAMKAERCSERSPLVVSSMVLVFQSASWSPFPLVEVGDRDESRILERWGPALEDIEMSRRSRRGDAEDVDGGECERGLNPLSLGRVWGPSSRKFQNLGVFLAIRAFLSLISRPINVGLPLI